VELGTGAGADLTISALSARDDELETCWREAPDIDALRQAADVARGLSLGRQVEWSRRLRAAGFWHLCPLIADAADQSLPGDRRARAAAAAWELDRDRQARAWLRVLSRDGGAGEGERADQHLGGAAAAELRAGPLVWSVTPFFNELDLLDARLSEMARAVDYFVVIEARQTFRGDSKPLYFQQDQHLFRRWSPQLHHVVVDLPPGPGAWEREKYQRDIARQVLADLGAKPEDLVLLTDLDEIVRADRVANVLQATANTPVILAMTQYWYSLDWKEPAPWLHPKAFRYGMVPEGKTYHDVRHSMYPVVPNSGWHISWFGDADRFDTKLKSFSHSELDTPDRHEAAFQKSLMDGGTDIHGRPLLRAHDYFPASFSRLFERKPAK